MKGLWRATAEQILLVLAVLELLRKTIYFMFFPNNKCQTKFCGLENACFAGLHIIARTARLTPQLSHNELQVEHGEWLVRSWTAVSCVLPESS